jgi:hypothetical protein
MHSHALTCRGKVRRRMRRRRGGRRRKGRGMVLVRMMISCTVPKQGRIMLGARTGQWGYNYCCYY